jgi:vancomycin resistance protein YoaR
MKTVRGKSSGVFGIQLAISCLVVIAVVISIIMGQWFLDFFNSNYIYEGIYIAQVDVSGKLPEEAENILMDRIQVPLAASIIELKSDLGTRSFSLAEIDFGYNIADAVRTAYSIGRKGNIIRRVAEILLARTRNANIGLEVTYNRQKLEDIIDGFYERTLVKMSESLISVSEDTLSIQSGHRGINIDKEKALQLAEEAIGNPGDITLDIPTQVILPSKIDVDKVYGSIFREPRNAVVLVENNEIVVSPHVNGRSIDRKTLAMFIEKAESNEDSFHSIELTITPPPLTQKEAEEMLFKDILAEASSRFYTNNKNDRNRGENIRIASEKIHNTLLGPGEVFSFNDVVGPRTAEAGYQVAHVYTAGEVVDGIGGGICQVSSTLYNAVLYAGLETVERWNHVFTVEYVPLGQDATVSYGSVDFKFRNSTAWPIRIEAEVTDTNLVIFRLVGTNEEPGKTIELVPEIKSVTPFSTVYIDDPSLPEGVEIIKQEGKKGYTVDTHKIVKMGNEISSSSILHRSTYKPLTRQVRRGTKKPEVPPSQPPEDPGHPGNATDTEDRQYPEDPEDIPVPEAS